MLSLLIRNTIFTVLQPGMVAGLIPYSLIKSHLAGALALPYPGLQIPAALVFVAGLAVTLTCILSFAFIGKGTLSPVDPTKKLVIRGLYRYSRNPMYIGVMLMLAGEALFFSSLALAGYAMLIFLLFHSFVVLREEPRLRSDFGEEYEVYCKEVGRWL